ncbi:2-hydroxyacyl-CoA dehydratase family protein [Candidatus Woesearchaeota archaeon]|nr:2-hydroxyacyl-CoA dehydratase family protein [Candidatus Woesearchaeota archaeon]
MGKNKVKSGNYSDDYDFNNKYKYKLHVEESKFAIHEAKENYVKLVAKNIQLMQNVKNRPENMKYFEEVITNPSSRIDDIRRFKQKGGKVIGTFCVQVPEELVYAAGAVPIRLSCGFYEAIPLAEEVLPANICSLVKSSIGFPFLKINPYFDLCDVIVIPTSCDSKKKMADILSNIKPVWPLELPNNKDSFDGMDKWQSQVRLFKKKLEKLTGKKIAKDKIKQAIDLLYKRTELSRRLLELRSSKKILINGRDSMLVIGSAFYDDINRWMQNLEKLCDELEQNLHNNKSIVPDDAPRLMVTGSPMIWPNFKVLNIIEEQGAVVTVDDSCAGMQYFYNPPEVVDWSEKSMMNAIANKYLLPTICPIFLHNDDRVDRILELMQSHSAEGVVYHIIRLCQVMDFDFEKVDHVLMSKNMPVLKIETEYGEEDTGQIRTRVEAFIEMIKARRA